VRNKNILAIFLSLLDQTGKIKGTLLANLLKQGYLTAA